MVMASKSNVVALPGAQVVQPWAVLGFDSERDMLLDDLKVLSGRIKDGSTPAHAIAALQKRKSDVLDQIKQLDAGDDEFDVLDDAEDEAWDVGG